MKGRAELAYECISCPVHGDRAMPISHSAICGEDCTDTHAYWSLRSGGASDDLIEFAERHVVTTAELMAAVWRVIDFAKAHEPLNRQDFEALEAAARAVVVGRKR